MNGSALNFNAANVKPDEGRTAVPAGWYNGKIVESELRPTKGGDGNYLYLQIQIIDGEFAGRMVFDRPNLKNPNPTAVEIGQARLSAYCHATGQIVLESSAQLHGIPFKFKVNKKDDPEYGESNNIQAVKPIEGGVTTQAAGSGAPAWAGAGAAAPAAAVAAAPAPTPAPAAPAAPAPAVATPNYAMTEKANGFTYEQFKAQNWTDQMLLDQGYMVASTPAPPAAPAAPAAPAVPTAPAAAAATGSGAPPPWQR